MVNVRIPAQAVSLRHLHPQVTARALGGITWTVSASAPSSPNQGDLWTNSADSYQLSQWTGSQWFAVPVNAGSLTGENFIIGASGQYHYASPPAFSTWGFESGLAGWTAVNASASTSPAWARSGSYSALLTYMSGTSWSFASPKQAVQAGSQVYVSAWVNAPQALGAVGLQLAWYDSGGTLLSTSSAPTAALAADTPAQLTYNAAPPSSAASAEIIVQDDETAVTGWQLFVDDVYIAGQLAVATAPSEGSDPLGNSHPAGLYTAGAYGTGVTMSTGSPLEAVPGNTGVTATPAGPAQQLGTGLWGPKMTGGAGYEDFASALMLSSQQGTPGTAVGGLVYTPGSGPDQNMLTWGAGGVTIGAMASPAGSSLSGGTVISQSDVSFLPLAGTVTTPSALCKVWPVPEGDPVAGTVYRISFPLSGTWHGNTLSFQVYAFGQALAPFTVGAALMDSGLAFSGDLTATVRITQTGSSGILTGSIRLNLGVTSDNQMPGGGANGAGGFAGMSVAEPVSGIGSADSNMTVQASFGASDSSQSIESFGSTFERIGSG